MARNKNEWKKAKDQIRILECLKSTVNELSERTNYVRSIQFEEKTESKDSKFNIILDCGAFVQKIVYYPFMLFSEQFIDVEFKFDHSEYTYTFYDIFNLFDIEDFNLYYYADLLSEYEIKAVLAEIFEATEKYYSYFEKAQAADYLPQLEKNYETDMENAYGSDDWKEDLKDDNESFLVPANHPLISFADGQINEKAIKKLKRKNDKDKLDTIYEKRLLNYIEAGNKVERKNISDKEEFEKVYRRNTLILPALIFAVSFVCFFAAYFIIQAILFKGAVMYPQMWNIFGKEVALNLDCFITFIFASFVLTAGMNFLFGKKLITKIMPENMKNRVEGRYNKNDKDSYGKLAKPVKLFGGILITVVALFLFICGFNDIGYYDTYVRYNSDVSFGITDVNYEDLKIYKVKFIYDGDEVDEDKLIKYENAYAISDGNGNYYDYGELIKDGKTETKLKEIAEKYNKEIIEIDSLRDISE